MQTCSNCFQAIKEDELVYSIVDHSPMHKECANKCPSCGEYITDMQLAKNKCKCIVQRKSSINCVRRSHIELYKTCHHAFHLEIIKGVEQKNNAYALHGIILHEIFDKYSKMEEIFRDTIVDEFIERFINEMPKDNYSFKDKPELYDALLDKGVDAIDSFVEYHSNTCLPFITEENIVFKLGDDLPEVSITMDRLDKIDDEYHMIDYKCGKTFTGKKLESDLQVPLYCFAVQYKYGKLPKTFKFLFLSEGKERLYTLDESTMTYTCTVRKKEYKINVNEKIREVIGILQNIKDGKTKGMCSNFWHCENMCYYKKAGICNGGGSNIWNIQ